MSQISTFFSHRLSYYSYLFNRAAQGFSASELLLTRAGQSNLPAIANHFPATRGHGCVHGGAGVNLLNRDRIEQCSFLLQQIL